VPPTLIVVGDVVPLQRTFAWFDPTTALGDGTAATMADGGAD